MVSVYPRPPEPAALASGGGPGAAGGDSHGRACAVQVSANQRPVSSEMTNQKLVFLCRVQFPGGVVTREMFRSVGCLDVRQ